MKLTALVLLGAPLASEASAGCPCKAQPANPKQNSAAGKPAYVGQAAAYGWNCLAHDDGQDICSTANDTDRGEPNDWCKDKWCIVDPANCDLNPRLVTYTEAADDYFAYEACDNGAFQGNGWIGRCKNCGPDHPESYNNGYYEMSHCTCGGADACKCLSTSQKQTPATDKPAYVGDVPSYGYGCMAHDSGYDVCNGTDTADGSSNDWCADQWCIVDKDSCDFKTRAVTYSAALDDYFSYETCDASFAGNGWVGRCACKGQNNSFCDGSEGFECVVSKPSIDLAGSSGLAGVVAALAALGILQ